MEPADFIVEMNNISKSFNGVQALKDVSINLKKNEVVGIVGHNGAGKSTLIKILSGAIRKDSGTILINKSPVDLAGPKVARNLGIETIYQDLALAGNLDVTANFFLGNEKSRYFFLRNSLMREEAKRVLQELKIRIESYTVPVEFLSGGQRQRIGIARALYHKPQVLILDEATSALDNLTEQVVMEAVHNIGKDITIILIAHRLSTVKECDTIFQLENGELKGQGSFEKLIEVNEKFRESVAKS